MVSFKEMKKHSFSIFPVIALFLCIHFIYPGHYPLEFNGKMRLNQPALSLGDSSEIRIKVKDLSRKFLSFYDAASAGNLSENARWLLWKRSYNFAAVPPTAQGDSMARKLLDNAWSRYPAIVAELKKGDLLGKPEPAGVLQSVTGLLKPGKPMDVTILSYIGGFEDNAFTNVTNEGIIVAIPRESPTPTRELLMTHEFTHAVQISMGCLSGGYIRSVGAIVVSEGLACRVTQSLHPNLGDGSFIEITPGWLQKCRDRQSEILKDVKTHLKSSDPNDIMKYTMGKSDLGIDREAYYAGWVVVQHWRAKGLTFAQIARIPEKDMPAKAEQAIDELLASGK